MFIQNQIIDVRSTFDRHGYLEIPNILPGQAYFSGLYEHFDAFVSAITLDPQIYHALETASHVWLSQGDNEAFFSEVPSRFADRIDRVDKANKVYFQASFDFLTFCLNVFKANNTVRTTIEPLFESLQSLIQVVERVLVPVVLALGENDERIVERLLPEGRRSAIIVRLIRYEPGPNSGTAAHHDKSGLSVILDSDDPDEDYFVLGRYGSSTMADLHRPYRHQASRGAWTSAIVFPGLCLQEAGFSWIKPTVHAVRPFSEERQRHAVVGFLLVPYLDMKHLQTTLDFRN